MLEISGSYVLSGLLLLAVGHVWRSNSEARRKLYEKSETNARAIAVLETRMETQNGDIKEIKADVKHLLERMPRLT